MRRLLSIAALSIGVLLAAPRPVIAQPAPLDTHQQLARDLLAELVAVPTVAGSGRTVQAAEAMRDRLVTAGFPPDDARVLGTDDRHGNLVARLRSPAPTAPPILLMAHLDVVDALRSDWSRDPFSLIEEDGYYYGRGATDNKAGAAMLVANFIRYRQEGFQPTRDLVIVLTADEETTGANIQWLLARHRPLIDAEFALNTDGGRGVLRDDRPSLLTVQAAEKVYQSYRLEVTNKGGHSSLPVPDNAIYRLAAGLTRLARHEFPVTLNESTRGFFEETARTEEAAVARDMRAILTTPPDEAAARRLAESAYYNAMMRTTCIATRLEAGHADNALPQTARATVNCRILPGEDPARVAEALQDVLGDPAIRISPIEQATPSPPSPLTPALMSAVGALVDEMFEGVPVVPEMSTGATDGLYTRNAGIPTYGVSALFEDPDDVRAHGRDERVGIQAFHDATEFWYHLVKRLADGR